VSICKCLAGKLLDLRYYLLKVVNIFLNVPGFQRVIGIGNHIQRDLPVRACGSYPLGSLPWISRAMEHDGIAAESHAERLLDRRQQDEPGAHCEFPRVLQRSNRAEAFA